MKFGIDKVVHCLMMAGFVFLWLFHTKKIRLVVFWGIFYGFALEVWQHILPIGRTFDVYDGLADAIGAVLGAMFWKIWPRQG